MRATAPMLAVLSCRKCRRNRFFAQFGEGGRCLLLVCAQCTEPIVFDLKRAESLKPSRKKAAAPSRLREKRTHVSRNHSRYRRGRRGVVGGEADPRSAEAKARSRRTRKKKS